MPCSMQKRATGKTQSARAHTNTEKSRKENLGAKKAFPGRKK